MNNITKEKFLIESRRYEEKIRKALTSEFGYIGDLEAGHIVDIEFDTCVEGNRVGIRLDNNYGVVDGIDAVRFAKALLYAAELAAKFEYLGYKVDDKRIPVLRRLGGDPCIYEGTESDVVYMRDNVTVSDVEKTFSLTGELVGVAYRYDGAIDYVEIITPDCKGGAIRRAVNDGIFYKGGDSE